MLSCTHLRISFPPVFLREAPSTATPMTALQHALPNSQLLLGLSLKPRLELGPLLLCDNIWALCFTRPLLLPETTLTLHLACLLNSHKPARTAVRYQRMPHKHHRLFCATHHHAWPLLYFFPNLQLLLSAKQHWEQQLPSSTKHNTQQ